LTDPILQYLIEGDFIGFIIACYTTKIGSLFWALLWMGLGGLLYIRTKQLILVCLLYTLLGGTFIMLTWMYSFVAVFFLLLGLAGVAWELYNTWRS